MFRGACRQVVYEMFIVWIQRSFLVEKNDISGYIWSRAIIHLSVGESGKNILEGLPGVLGNKGYF